MWIPRACCNICFGRFCQPSARTPSWSWLPIVVAPGCLGHPTSTVSDRATKLFTRCYSPSSWQFTCGGSGWGTQHVLFHSHNAAVVHILNSRTPSIVKILPHLMLSAVRDSFSFSAKHIPSINNQVADALSCSPWEESHHLAPAAQPLPTPIPSQLLAELITSL